MSGNTWRVGLSANLMFSGNGILITDSHGSEVLIVPCWGMDDEHEIEAIKNANLVAAAPDMFAALKAQAEVRKVGLLNMTDEEIQRVDTLRETAIAKATGEQSS